MLRAITTPGYGTLATGVLTGCMILSGGFANAQVNCHDISPQDDDHHCLPRMITDFCGDWIGGIRKLFRQFVVGFRVELWYSKFFLA
jgi:hypothetical protein